MIMILSDQTENNPINPKAVKWKIRTQHMDNKKEKRQVADLHSPIPIN